MPDGNSLNFSGWTVASFPKRSGKPGMHWENLDARLDYIIQKGEQFVAVLRANHPRDAQGAQDAIMAFVNKTKKTFVSAFHKHIACTYLFADYKLVKFSILVAAGMVGQA